MYTVQEELALEERMVIAGQQRFNLQNERGEALGETSYAKRLLPAHFKEVATAFEAFVNGSGAARYGKYRRMMKNCSAEQLALFTLREIFSNFMKQRSVQVTALNIGQAIEDEQRFSKFQQQNEDKYRIVLKELEKTRTKAYSHRHAVFTITANNTGQEWEAWSIHDRASIGMKCIELVCASTQLVELVVETRNSKPVSCIRPTAECLSWVEKHIDQASMLHPMFCPSILPPLPWDSINSGGYYSPRMRSRMPLVKAHSKEHTSMLDYSDMPRVYTAINAIQSTAWEINGKVHDVIKEVWRKNLRVGMPPSEPYEIPPAPVEREKKKADMNPEELLEFKAWCSQAAAIYTLERERVAKCYQIVQTLRLAAEYREYGVMYFPMHADFRGRLYSACTDLSPQGGDCSKGLLRFKKGKPIGAAGEKWFLLHGAGKYGWDKLSFDDRIAEVRRHHQAIIDAANDPLSNIAFWGNADKPWQFLAWCFEYAEYIQHGTAFVSHLPMSLDGSCNGLQHYSAMLRDPIGGAATNLRAASKPQDIYQQVADKVKAKLEVASDPLSAAWLEYGIDRKLAKPPVMTLPYGSTRQTCTSSILAHIMAHNRAHFGQHPFKAALFLSGILWDSIGEVVVSARTGMAWLRKVAGVVGKQNKPCTWTSGLNFPVYQKACAVDVIRVKQTIYGKTHRVNFGILSDQIDVQHMRSGIAPNFVHSLDATHMMRTINVAFNEGIEDFACIHDDYGVHAADTDRFFNIIREEFVGMYTDTNPLEKFKEEQEENLEVVLPDIPASGNLDITEVLNSEYFFS